MLDVSRTIWRYDVPIAPTTPGEPVAYPMPAGAVIVHCAVGPTTPSGHVSVWAVVDPKAPKAFVALRVVGTGHPLNPGERWVGTAPAACDFVWHVVRTEEDA